MENSEERKQIEIDLLQAMYPDQMLWNNETQELSYKTNSASFILRLPDSYLSTGRPTVISAAVCKTDVSDRLRRFVKDQDVGVEILDSIVLEFNDTLDSFPPTADGVDAEELNSLAPESTGDEEATIVVWLHHLLNTNKRKQCLSVPAGISGVTKPGYPGVLIYSGPADAVREQVDELKQLNWAAFQVRLEDQVGWSFSHGRGMSEVQTMGEVVAEVGERKDVLMEALRMK